MHLSHLSYAHSQIVQWQFFQLFPNSTIAHRFVYMAFIVRGERIDSMFILHDSSS